MKDKPGRTAIRSTKAQINYLCKYMLEHPTFAAGEYRTPMEAEAIYAEWQNLKIALDQLGPKRSVEQWKIAWRDQKRKARAECGAFNKAINSTGDVAPIPKISENSMLVLNAIGAEMTDGYDLKESSANCWRGQKKEATAERGAFNKAMNSPDEATVTKVLENPVPVSCAIREDTTEGCVSQQSPVDLQERKTTATDEIPVPKLLKLFVPVVGTIGVQMTDGCGSKESLMDEFTNEVPISNVRTQERINQTIRSTKAQIHYLRQYMSEHPAFAAGDYRSPMRAARNYAEWKKLKVALDQLGPKRSVGQWKICWRDQKRKARVECQALAGNSRDIMAPIPKISKKLVPVLSAIGEEIADDCGLQDSPSDKRGATAEYGAFNEDENSIDDDAPLSKISEKSVPVPSSIDKEMTDGCGSKQLTVDERHDIAECGTLNKAINYTSDEAPAPKMAEISVPLLNAIGEKMTDDCGSNGSIIDEFTAEVPIRNEVTKEHISQTIRSTKAQIHYLRQYMSQHLAFAAGDYRTQMRVIRNNIEWKKLKVVLDVLGPKRSVRQWKICWRDQKRKVRAEYGAFNKAKNYTSEVALLPKISEESAPVLREISKEMTDDYGFKKSPIDCLRDPKGEVTTECGAFNMTINTTDGEAPVTKISEKSVPELSAIAEDVTDDCGSKDRESSIDKREVTADCEALNKAINCTDDEALASKTSIKSEPVLSEEMTVGCGPKESQIDKFTTEVTITKVEPQEQSNHVIRSTKAQIHYLRQYMSQHPAFAAGDYRTPMRAARNNIEWKKLKVALDELGPKRSVRQWKICWRDQKRKARAECEASNRAKNYTGVVAILPKLLEKPVPVLREFNEKITDDSNPKVSPIDRCLGQKREATAERGAFNEDVNPIDDDVPLSKISKKSVSALSAIGKEITDDCGSKESLIDEFSDDVPISNLVTKEHLNQTIRSTKAQIHYLRQYMSQHPAFAAGDYRTPMRAARNNIEWKKLKVVLDVLGPKRSVRQWKICWRDQKRKVRAEYGAFNKAKNYTSEVALLPKISEESAPVLREISKEMTDDYGFKKSPIDCLRDPKGEVTTECGAFNMTINTTDGEAPVTKISEKSVPDLSAIAEDVTDDCGSKDRESSIDKREVTADCEALNKAINCTDDEALASKTSVKSEPVLSEEMTVGCGSKESQIDKFTTEVTITKVEPQEQSNHVIRSTKAQIHYLRQYMSQHPAFAAGDYRTPMRAARNNIEWKKLKVALDELGPKRSVRQWKICWRDQKRKARAECEASNRAKNYTGVVAILPKLLEKPVPVLREFNEKITDDSNPKVSPIDRCLGQKREATAERGAFNEDVNPIDDDVPLSKISKKSVSALSAIGKEITDDCGSKESLIDEFSDDVPISNLVTKEHLNQTIRSTKAQIHYLRQYMSQHPAFAAGDYRTPMRAARNNIEWKKLKVVLDVLGPKRSVRQWKICWRDQKRKVRAEYGAFNKAKNYTSEVALLPKISEESAPVLREISKEMTDDYGFKKSPIDCLRDPKGEVTTECGAFNMTINTTDGEAPVTKISEKSVPDLSAIAEDVTDDCGSKDRESSIDKREVTADCEALNKAINCTDDEALASKTSVKSEPVLSEEMTVGCGSKESQIDKFTTEVTITKVEPQEQSNHVIRSTKAQIHYLRQYMSQHPAFAAGDYRTPMRAARNNIEWKKLKVALDELGPKRSVRQWKICWRDQKRKARAECEASNRAKNYTGVVAILPKLLEKPVPVLREFNEKITDDSNPKVSPIDRCLGQKREATAERGAFNEDVNPIDDDVPLSKISKKSVSALSAIGKEITDDCGSKESLIDEFSDDVPISNVVTKEHLNRTIRSTKAQIHYLRQYMSQHPAFAAGDYRTPMRAARNNIEWKKLKVVLDILGPKRSVRQWKICWRDQKRKARAECKALNKSLSYVAPIPKISEKSVPILRAIGKQMADDSILQKSPINKREATEEYGAFKRALNTPDDKDPVSKISEKLVPEPSVIGEETTDGCGSMESLIDEFTTEVDIGNEVTQEHISQTIRSTKAQINFLRQFMLEHPAFASADYRTPMGAATNNAEWKKLKVALDKLGPNRSVGQWKTAWRDQKRKARAEYEAFKKATSNAASVPEISEKLVPALSSISDETTDDCGPKASLVDEFNTEVPISNVLTQEHINFLSRVTKMTEFSELNSLKQETELECRACLQKLESDSLFYNLFDCWPEDADSLGRTIAEDLSDIAGISLLENDEYSKIICAVCLTLLQSSCNFITSVRVNDNVLRQRYVYDDQSKTGTRIWPKPILVDKNVNSVFINNPEVKVKEEVLSDSEYDSVKEQDCGNMEIKVEPEEIQEHAPQTMVNGIENPSNENTEDKENIEGKENAESKENTETKENTELHLANGVENNEDQSSVGDNSDKLSEPHIKEEQVSDDDDSESVSTDLPLECLLCLKSFNSVTGLKAHVIAQHSYKTVKRKSGNMISPEKKKIKYTCSICRRCFSTSTDLMVHETCHNKSVCYGCNKNFETFNELTRHRRMCKAISNKEIRKLRTLNDVKRPKSNESQIPFKCSQCDEVFSDSYYLTIHQEVHHTTKYEQSVVSDEDNTMETEVLERLFEKND